MKLTGFFFYAPLVGLAFCLVLVGYFVVGKNLLLRDVVFSYSALIAAFVMFMLNLYFSLNNNAEQSKSTITSFISHRENSISVVNLKSYKEQLGILFELKHRTNFSYYYGIPHHTAASNLEVEERYVLFDKLYGVAKTIYLGDMLTNFPDWDAKKRPITEGGGTSARIGSASAGNDTFYTVPELISCGELNFPTNLLTPFIGEGLTLPPKTRIKGNRDSLTIENPFVVVNIDFAINLNYERNTMFSDDGSPYGILDDRPHEYNVYTMQPTFSVVYNKLYAGHRKSARYKQWVADLESVFHHSFSTYSKTSPHYTA